MRGLLGEPHSLLAQTRVTEPAVLAESITDFRYFGGPTNYSKQIDLHMLGKDCELSAELYSPEFGMEIRTRGQNE